MPDFSLFGLEIRGTEMESSTQKWNDSSEHRLGDLI